WKLTAEENLCYFGALKGVRQVRRRVGAILDKFELSEHRKKRVGELSRGLQQRVAIAVALLNEPQILLLDEPTLGLDVVASSAFRSVVRAIADEGCGIILTTHQMEVAQALSDRIAIIARGRVSALASLEQLMASYRVPGYEVVVTGRLDEAMQAELAERGAHSFANQTGRARFLLPEGQDLYGAMAPLERAGLELYSIQQQEVNLEEIYVRIVSADEPTPAPEVAAR
ncbi:MAG: ABC transporter ATP-binding protein, partial [Cyanobacteria bacterium REEB65]|nr:ABC transporter ATP-binding protein [Cyanobacteria bacterium REEB65]